jgi:hypothetical protein
VLAWLLDQGGEPEVRRWIEDAEAGSTDVTPPDLDVA